MTEPPPPVSRQAADASGRRWRRRPGTTWRRTLRGVVVLAPAAPEPVAVTGSVDELWALLDRPRSLPELVSALSESFDVPSEVLAADVARVLDQLDAAGALEALAPAEPA